MMPPSPFIEQVRSELRTRHYSLRTEKTYLYWIRHFIRFNNKRHPETMGNLEIEHFLNYLANDRRVSAATQNQALCALVFMYRHVIKRQIEDLNYGFAKRPKNIPTVLSAQEVTRILAQLSGKYWLITAILYGCGLRIHEALFLRIKDIDLHHRSILVFRGKGAKDRYTLLPESLLSPISEQIAFCKTLHQNDLSEGYGFTSIDSSLKRKYGSALMDFSWQYLFPSSTRCQHPYDGYICRHHLHGTAYAKQLRKAAIIRTVQELLGYADLRTTEIYTHVVNQRHAGTRSPIDALLSMPDYCVEGE